MNFLLISTLSLFAFCTFAAASAISSARDIIIRRFSDAYQGCLTGEHPVELTITPYLPPFGCPRNAHDFVITASDKEKNFKLHFTFRVFSEIPSEEFLRPSAIPLDQKYVKFFANEWEGVNEYFKQMNPFCENSRLFEIKSAGASVAWVSLNFNYMQFGKYLQSSNKLEVRRFIHKVFKNPSSESFLHLDTAIKTIFSAPVQVEAQVESLLSSATKAIRSRVEYRIEDIIEPFFKDFINVKIKDIASLSSSDCTKITSQNFELTLRMVSGKADEFSSCELDFNTIYSNIQNGFTSCSNGFNGAECPALSWIAPQLPIFKRVVKVNDIFVCIAGVHTETYDYVTPSDQVYENFLNNHGMAYPFMIITVKITNKDYMYGAAPFKDEFRIVVLKQ